MRVLDVAQGSDEWRKARLGLLTASRMDRIITPKTGKPSAQAAGLVNELLAEWLLGAPLDDASSGFMERGTEMEGRARGWYAFERDIDPARVGLCLRDDGRVGCSPDALVGEDGGLELKVPAADTHVGYLLDPSSLVAEYRCQIQGCLYVTGRKWWDACSWHPTIPPVLARSEPEPAFQSALHEAVESFLARLEECRARLVAMGLSAGKPSERFGYSGPKEGAPAAYRDRLAGMLDDGRPCP